MTEEFVTCLEGPVEKIGGRFTLLIPLAAGGDKFIECSRGISEIEGECLRITIPETIAGMLRIEEGSRVSVDNRDGKLNIFATNPLPLH